MDDNNRRRYYRPDCFLDAKYSIEGTYVKNKAIVKNVSAIGACIITDEYIPLEIEMKLTIYLPETVPVEMLCKVLRCMKSKDENKFELGLLFIGITDSAKEKLVNFISKNLIY